MRKLRSRVRDDDRGASAVELALLAPFLAALLVGSIQIAFMFNRSQDLESAARESARYASDYEDRTKTEIIARAMNALEDTDGVAIAVSPDVDNPCTGRQGQTVSVSVSVDEDLDLLFASTVTIGLGGTADFVCSNNQAPPTPIPITPTPTP